MGYVKLDRKILDWEWWSDVNTYRVFTYCLIRANWKESRFKGVDVPRGAFITSLKSLSKATNLSIQQVRTALDHLKSTGEVTLNSHAKFSVVIVNNYIQYQDDNTIDNTQVTSNQHDSNTQVTTEEEYKNNKNNKKENIKHKYGEYSHVRLTDKEYEGLITDYGEKAVLEGIKNVDEYVQTHSKAKYNDYNLVLRKWGIKSPKITPIISKQKNANLQLRDPYSEEDALAHPISEGWMVNDDGYWINERLGIN